MSVQCRVRACTSFPRLPRARALTYRKERTSPSLSLAVSPLLCVYTSLSRSPFLSRYIRICCLSLLRVYVCICVYPLLRGSFSRRINLYVYKQPSAFRVRVRNALLPPTCVVTFGRSLARSQASPRAPLSVCMHTHIQRVRGGNGTTLDRSVSLVVLNAVQLPREAFSLLRLFLFRLREFRVKLVFAYEKSVIKILLLFRISEG